MEILTQILGLVLSLSILVILHETGHFIFARLFHTRVEKFYLFFNSKRGKQSTGWAGYPWEGMLRSQE